MKRWAWLFPVIVLAPLWACQGDDEDKADPSPRVRGKGEARRVRIQRILISYRENPFNLTARRSLEEARALAERLYMRAKSGENFVKLRDGYSDDRQPGGKVAAGPYVMLNYDTELAPTMPTVPRMIRMDMGRRLGDAVFRMQPGEIALVEYHKVDYPVGYEVVLCEMRDERNEAQVAEDLKRRK